MFGSGFDPGNQFPGASVADPLFAPAPAVDQRDPAPPDRPMNEIRIELPPPAEMPAWIAAFVGRDGLRAVLEALLRVAPAERLMALIEELCDQQFGEEPDLDGGTVRACERAGCERLDHLLLAVFAQAGWEVRSPQRGTDTLLERTVPRTPTSYAGGVAVAFDFGRCKHCEPYMGQKADKCIALKTLEGIRVDIEEEMQQVQEAEVGACYSKRTGHPS
jgi:hypothetical protein